MEEIQDSPHGHRREQLSGDPPANRDATQRSNPRPSCVIYGQNTGFNKAMGRLIGKDAA
jgi:hypothetical protein